MKPPRSRVSSILALAMLEMLLPLPTERPGRRLRPHRPDCRALAEGFVCDCDEPEPDTTPEDPTDG